MISLFRRLNCTLELKQDHLLRSKIPATTLIGNRKLYNEQQKTIELISNKVKHQSVLLQEKMIEFDKLKDEITILEPKLESAILKLDDPLNASGTD